MKVRRRSLFILLARRCRKVDVFLKQYIVETERDKGTYSLRYTLDAIIISQYKTLECWSQYE